MKGTLSICIGLFIGVTAFSQTTKKACFLGNSYTYVNDLPQLIEDLATADGNTFIHDQNTPGGYTLEGHSSNTTSLSKIAEDEWDYVVLQDQSQRPSFPWSQVNEEVFPFAEFLCDSIRSTNACAKPLFFNTWGRRDGDDQWDSIDTFHKMNYRLNIAYDYMADKNSGKLSPVGIGFQHINEDLTSPVEFTALYTGDGSHPSVFGSYLAACIFYEVIFETSSEGNTFVPAGIDATQATYLQDVANHVVNEVDSVTIDYTIPVPSYEVSWDGLTATFTNTSQHAFSYLWDFGDGATSTEENPVHTYADSEEYTVTLTANYCDHSNTTTVTEIPTIKEWTVYPNPTKGQFRIKGDLGVDSIVRIYNTLGQSEFVSEIGQKEFSLNLKAGVYFVKVGEESQILILE
jgi:hypothetical protein